MCRSKHDGAPAWQIRDSMGYAVSSHIRHNVVRAQRYERYAGHGVEFMPRSSHVDQQRARSARWNPPGRPSPRCTWAGDPSFRLQNPKRLPLPDLTCYHPLVKKSKAFCQGCTDDFYNGHNDLGVKECWSYPRATVVKAYRIGWWTPCDSKKNFTRVVTLDCHHAPGRYAQYRELPKHLR